MSKQIIFDTEAKEKLKKGIDTLADAVTSTLGPSGRNVIYKDEYGVVKSTKDGVSVAKMIKNLENPIEDLGADIIRQAALKTLNVAGDGTTTSTLLAQILIANGLSSIKNGNNAVDVKRGMDKALKLVITELKKLSKPITDDKQIKQVATISANNDEEVGNLVAEALKKVGRDGLVTVEEGNSYETVLDVVEGIQFNRGFKSPHFVTNTNNMTAVLNEAYILICDKKLQTSKELLPILDKVSQESKSLLLIAEDIDGEALALMIVNKIRGNLKVVAVKAPDFGERRAQVLEDIAILTGGQVVSSEKGMKLDKFDLNWLGYARVVTVNKDDTTIIDGKGDATKIKERILSLKAQLDKSNSDFEIEKLQERLAKLLGGVAVISVGGSNEMEIREKKDRIDDSLQATKAAIEEGILPGGGVALIHASKVLNTKKLNKDEALGFAIVEDALSSPFFKILENAGYPIKEITSIYSKIYSKKDIWKGFNPRVNKMVDMFDDGILDPTKVIRASIENAVGVAGMLLITEAVIVEEKSEKKEQPEYEL